MYAKLPSTIWNNAAIGNNSLYGGFPVYNSIIVHPRLLFNGINFVS